MARIKGRRRQKLPLSRLVMGIMVIMAVTLLYVWFQVNNTKTNYAIAREMQVRERLVEEGRQLRIEVEVLKSSRRIEGIAKDTLKMRYPSSNQVVLLNE